MEPWIGSGGATHEEKVMLMAGVGEAQPRTLDDEFFDGSARTGGTG